MVAVAWEQALFDRAGRRLRTWVARGIKEAEKEILALRQAVSWMTGITRRYGYRDSIPGMDAAPPLTCNIPIAGKKLPSLDLLSTVTAQR